MDSSTTITGTNQAKVYITKHTAPEELNGIPQLTLLTLIIIWGKVFTILAMHRITHLPTLLPQPLHVHRTLIMMASHRASVITDMLSAALNV
jgi:hypothetical protein